MTTWENCCSYDGRTELEPSQLQQGPSSFRPFATWLWHCLQRGAACVPGVSLPEGSGLLPREPGSAAFHILWPRPHIICLFYFPYFQREILAKICLGSFSNKYVNAHLMAYVPSFSEYYMLRKKFMSWNFPSDRIHFFPSDRIHFF